VTHEATGESFCLQSCYLENGGCPVDEFCYYEKKDGEECNPLLQSCFQTTCTDTADPGSCPSGWTIGPCGSLCQRTCKQYVSGELFACPEICAPPDCVCPRGMVVFRDRCVDPLECYSLMTNQPDLNPLPAPRDAVLLRVTLANVDIEDVDGAQFAADVQQLVRGLGFDDVAVSLYATMEEDDGTAVIVLRFKGKSIDRKSSPDRLVDIMTDNEAQLNHEVASVRSVTKTETGEPEEVADDTVPGGAIAGGVVAGVVVITALVAAVAFAAVYLFSKRKPPSRDSRCVCVCARVVVISFRVY
jgi:hypothetical protein